MEKIHCVKRNESKPSRNFAHQVLQYLHKYIKLLNSQQKDKSKQIIYNPRRVGSAVTNTIVTNTDGSFDLDYQFVLTREINISPTEIRNIFSRSIKDVFSKEMRALESIVKIEDSTSVITVKRFNNLKKLEYSFDFAIVSYLDDKINIIRRNAQGNNQQQYTWNELPCIHRFVYDEYKKLPQDKKRLVCDEVINRKIKSKKLREDRPGFSHFIEVMQGYNNEK